MKQQSFELKWKEGKIFPSVLGKWTNGLSFFALEGKIEQQIGISVRKQPCSSGLSKPLCLALTLSIESGSKQLKIPCKTMKLAKWTTETRKVSIFSLFHSQKVTFYFVAWFYLSLLYTWHFPRYCPPIHWLVHGHMTSNNETISRKCHEQATFRKLWRQTGNSSLLPAKCWPLLHVIRGGPMLSLESRLVFQTLLLFCYITNHLFTDTLGNSEFCFPRISMFPLTSSRETKFTVPLGTSH